jgi:chromosome segregation ATPase
LSRRSAEFERRHAVGLEAELAHRLAEVERREREVALEREALQAQRERLDAVRLEYESRREAIAARARELDSDRERLRNDRAQLVAEELEIEQRERAVASAAAALVEQPSPSSAPPAPVDPTDEGGDWWAKQLHGAAAAALH